MTCAACVAHVERSLSSIDGISELSVSLLTDSMTLVYDESKVSCELICEAVKRGGYSASVAGEKKEYGGKKAENAKRVRALVLSFVFLAFLMYFSMSHMLPLPEFLSHPVTVAVLQMVFLAPILAINRRFIISGARALISRAPNMDSLIFVGVSGSVLYGLFGFFMILSGKHEYVMALYFESAGMILTLVSLGKMLEARARGKTGEAIEMLAKLAPKIASVERDGVEVTVPSDKIEIGDTVIVRAGESVPVDGTVIYGSGSADESHLTGESMPEEKGEGDALYEASILSSGFVKMRAERVGEGSSLSQIIRLLEEAAASKAPIARMADKVSGVFVPIVMSISLITLVIWLLLGGGAEAALRAAISVLVISCPCALGLATPTAIMVGSGRGAQLGVLIKSAEALEMLSHIKFVLLDKTGTITRGKPAVTDIIGLGVADDELFRLVYSLELMSEHPISEAFKSEAAGKGISPYEVSGFSALRGFGVVGKINGKELLFGNRKLLLERGIDFTNDDLLTRLSEEGKTPMIAAYDGVTVGIIAVSDREKDDSAAAIARMKQMGITPIMLTGDNERTAAAIAKRVGIEKVYASVLPDGKERIARELKKEGRVAMIGDGINDAPALASADLGIAIGAGSGIAIESADVVLRRSSLLDAVSAFELGRATLRNIKQNLFWALLYNSIGIPLAAGAFVPILGWQLSPMIASAAMSLSSVCVVTNALRLRAFKPYHINKKQKEENKMKERIMIIEGMMCPHCQARVEQLLGALEGASAKVILEEKKAVVNAPESITNEALAKAVTDAGYKVISVE